MHLHNLDLENIRKHPILGNGTVVYQCHCTAYDHFQQYKVEQPPMITPTTNRFLNKMSMVQQLTLPLMEYFYCRDCAELCCKRCIKEKVLFHYCPMCMFEIAGAITQAEKMKCWRNCMICPICDAGLTLLEKVTNPEDSTLSIEIPPDNSQIGSNSEVPREFFFRCSTCKYDTREFGIKLDKIGSLANTIQTYQQLTLEHTEVSNLELQFDLDYMIPHFFDFNPALYAIEEVEGFNIKVSDLFKLRGREYRSQLDKLIQREPKGEKVDGKPTPGIVECQLRDRERERVKMVLDNKNLNAPSINEILNYGTYQPIHQIHNIYPKRQPLRTRKSKHCPRCDLTLCEPSGKASQEHRFHKKLPAYRFVPEIQVLDYEKHLHQLRPNEPVVLKLKFTNPMHYKVFIHLSTPLSKDWIIKGESNHPEDIHEETTMNQDPLKRFESDFNHRIHLPTPKFSIDKSPLDSEINLPSEESKDLSDDEVEEAQPVSPEKILGLDYDSKLPYQGIFERNLNTTTIYITLIPNINEKDQEKLNDVEVVIPFLMAFTTKIERNKLDHIGEGELELEEFKEDQYEDFTRHVWVYLRLGKLKA